MGHGRHINLYGICAISVSLMALILSGCQFEAKTTSGDTVNVSADRSSIHQFFERTDQYSQEMLQETNRLGDRGLHRVMSEFRTVFLDLRSATEMIDLEEVQTLERKLFAFEYQLDRRLTSPQEEERYGLVLTLLRHLKKEMRRVDAIISRTDGR